MKPILIFSIALFLFCTKAKAQCDEARIKNKAGSLKKVTDICGGRYTVTATDLAAAKKNILPVEKFFTDNYKPTGFNATYVTNFICTPSSADIYSKNRYGNPYSYMLQNFFFYCHKGMEKVNAESSVTLLININSGLAIDEEKDIPVYYYKDDVTTGMGFSTLLHTFLNNGRLPDISKGWLGFGNTWWITKKGKLPFQYVTRKAFLQKQIALNKARINGLKKMNYDYSMWENQLKAYEKELQKDEEWLSQKAIVQQAEDKNKIYRYVFTQTFNHKTEIPIVPNPSYYNRKISKAAPQIISIRLLEGAKINCEKAIIKIIEDHIEQMAAMITE